MLRSLESRFWPKVEKTDGCWLWRASKTGPGYGQLWDMRVRRPELAHRVAYELLVGPIPEGLQLDHLCRVRHCVNPAHLEPVTHRENTLRGESPQAKLAALTHCKYGHELTGSNLCVTSRGYRQCMTCNRRRARESYHRRVAAA